MKSVKLRREVRMALFYTEEVIQEVVAANDIVDIVSGYVKLKRVGRGFVGICPFHNEKTPSFSVSQDKQLYHCFGCGAGGTVIQFIMSIEGLDFIEAVKFLAERAGIHLPEGNSDGDEARRFEKKQLALNINKEAAHFFHKCLMSDEGRYAREYLENRGIKPKTIISFGLGFSPNSWDALFKHLINCGYTVQDILDVGLIVENKNKNTYYDRFRNRIMFPIIDVRGNVVGFGGRVMGDSKPKYLNSPETIVFNKSRNLYGLNFAKNSKKNQLIVVEGYMDVISLHQNGIINTVASLGTALTPEQAKMIARFCSEVVIAYDSDEAGQAATIKGIEVLSEAGCKVKVLVLDEGKDPDEFIRSRGVERFEKAVKNSKSHIEYKIDLLKTKYDINDIEQKIAFVNAIAKIFAAVDNAVERDAYVKRISEKTGISSQAIFTEIEKIASKNSYKNKKNLKLKPVRPAESIPQKEYLIKTQKPESNVKLLNAEKMLLNLLCYDKSVFNAVKGMIGPKDFTYKVHAKMAEVIYDLREKGINFDAARLISMFEDEEVKQVTSILHMETFFDDNNDAAMELIDTIKKEKTMKGILSSLKEGNVEKLQALLIEYKGLQND
ncbi:MAG: DNA primase [Clostridiaceae bacterium]|nr:DNA primase [Clostridiaceae bacterium]